MHNKSPTAWFREPLLHFLLIGAALFALYAWVNPGGFDDDHVISVTPGRIEQLRAHFQRTWNRPPSREELDALIDNFVVEEIYYRQAVAMGLDKGDDMIRRRLRQKMEFLTTEAVNLYEPDDSELQAYLEAHPDQFLREARYTFEQLYFSPDSGAAPPARRAAAAREGLVAGREVQGDQSLLPSAVQGASASQVDRSFGEGFAQSLDGLPLGEWSQPLPSGLGVHLVRLSAREPARAPELAEVRGQVLREWQNSRNEEAKQALVSGLKAGYEIVIERADPEERG